MSATDTTDMKRAWHLTEALRRAGLDWSHIYALERDGMTALLEAIPMMHVDSELHRLRDIAAQQPWTPNDLNDLTALTRAVVYCDVVVTENQWASLIRRARLDERYETVVVADLRELPTLLV